MDVMSTWAIPRKISIIRNYEFRERNSTL